MNNREDELLAEAFYDNWATAAPVVYAQQAARSARVRRRLRAAIVVCAVLGTAIPVSWSINSHLGAPSTRSATAARHSYQIISDAELLAEVHDRPLLAIRDGKQIRQIVVLAND